MSKDKVVLAYSGGLDTSVSIKWLQEKYGMEVVAVTINLGQISNMLETKEKALKIGAVQAEVVDAQDEFAEDYVLPALKANALYEGKYPLATALGRPLIVKHLVKKAEGSGAKAIAHGCTGKGNDQVRFDVGAASLNPSLKIIAPLREWEMTREEEIEYAKRNRIPTPVGLDESSPYSVDENLWGRSIECGILEDPLTEPPPEVYKLTVDPEDAPNKAQYIEVSFEKGEPSALDGQKMELVDLIKKMNELCGKHSFGRIDMVENRLVGIKSREVYEAPGALALILAHRGLEEITLERDVLHYKAQVEQKYAELVYNGLWFSPLKQALDAFIDKTQQRVSGQIRLKLFKGCATVVGRKSPYSLYDYGLATYDKKDIFPHQAAKGFIEVLSLPLKVWSKKKGAK